MTLVALKIRLEFASVSHCNYGCDVMVITHDGYEYCALYPEAGSRLRFDHQCKLPHRDPACIAAHGGAE